MYTRGTVMFSSAGTVSGGTVGGGQLAAAQSAANSLEAQRGSHRAMPPPVLRVYTPDRALQNNMKTAWAQNGGIYFDAP